MTEAAVEKTPLLSLLLTQWITDEKSEGLAQANYANASALLFQNLRAVNWAGFYFYDEKLDELVLGPFLGKPAVVRIKPGNGVVGKTYTSQETTVVADVHSFAGHIACDSDSNAEIVVPVTTVTGKKLGVLDIDSTEFDRFTDQDKSDLEHFVQTLLQYI